MRDDVTIAAVPDIVIVGSTGQLGSRLVEEARRRGLSLQVLPRSVALSNADAVASAFSTLHARWVVNAAAMTDVDGAHGRPDYAMAVNGIAPGLLAGAAHAAGARFLQVSTEAVFSGESSRPYQVMDPCAPVSVYGATKLAGEHLATIYDPDAVVFRTSWLYSGGEGANFPTRLLAQLRDHDRSVSVVTDVVGNPTPVSVLTAAILDAVSLGIPAGTYHVCCTGAASKFDWAVEIARSSGFDAGRIVPVTSDAYPTVALRPKHVDLDVSRFISTGIMPLPTWQAAWEAERPSR